MNRKPRILVVDDDQPILALMRNVLKEFDFEPVTASSGGEAMEQLRRDPPDLILVDIHMPGMTGMELISAIRAQRTTADVPVVILSGEPMRSEEIEAIGAAGAVLKPFELEDLIAQIRSHVSRRSHANGNR